MTMTQSSAQHFTAGVALSHPATQEALARYRQRWAKLLKIGLILTPVSLVGFLGTMAWRISEDFVELTAIVLVGLTVVLAISFVGVVWGITLSAMAWHLRGQAGRMEWILAHYPWRERYRYRVRAGSKVVAVYIEADQVGPRVVCLVSGAFGRSWIGTFKAAAGNQFPLLVAGDPGYWAVVTLPDMQNLFILKPPDRLTGALYRVR